MNTIALIRDQVRATVDPMFIKLRHELFGSTFNGSIKESLVPTAAIENAITKGIEEALDPSSIVPPMLTYVAGPDGVQTGKVVYYDGTVVHHADSTVASHAGKVVGIASEVAGPGGNVRVCMYGALDLPGSLSLTPATALILGANGGMGVAVPSGAAFVQFLGVALTSTKMLVYVSPDLYIL